MDQGIIRESVEAILSFLDCRKDFNKTEKKFLATWAQVIRSSLEEDFRDMEKKLETWLLHEKAADVCLADGLKIPRGHIQDFMDVMQTVRLKFIIQVTQRY